MTGAPDAQLSVRFTTQNESFAKAQCEDIKLIEMNIEWQMPSMKHFISQFPRRNAHPSRSSTLQCESVLRVRTNHSSTTSPPLPCSMANSVSKPRFLSVSWHRLNAPCHHGICRAISITETTNGDFREMIDLIQGCSRSNAPKPGQAASTLYDTVVPACKSQYFIVRRSSAKASAQILLHRASFHY